MYIQFLTIYNINVFTFIYEPMVFFVSAHQGQHGAESSHWRLDVKTAMLSFLMTARGTK